MHVRHFARSGEADVYLLAKEIESTLIVILSDIEGLERLRKTKQRCPDLPAMMVTAYGDAEGCRSVGEVGVGGDPI
jgi:hypothetical protein